MVVAGSLWLEGSSFRLRGRDHFAQVAKIVACAAPDALRRTRKCRGRELAASSRKALWPVAAVACGPPETAGTSFASAVGHLVVEPMSTPTSAR